MHYFYEPPGRLDLLLTAGEKKEGLGGKCTFYASSSKTRLKAALLVRGYKKKPFKMMQTFLKRDIGCMSLTEIERLSL